MDAWRGWIRFLAVSQPHHGTLENLHYRPTTLVPVYEMKGIQTPSHRDRHGLKMGTVGLKAMEVGKSMSMGHRAIQRGNIRDGFKRPSSDL